MGSADAALPLTESVRLAAGGIAMPVLGLGTWKVDDDAAAYDAVRRALELGYRHIDTAAIYRNEVPVGRAIRESGIPREEIFVTTKCWNEDLRAGRVAEACDHSLQLLGLDYLDLYLLHWAVGDLKALWEQALLLRERGRTRAVGVSNYLIEHLEVLASVGPLPQVNQIEWHPHLQSPELVRYCQERQIVLEAWSPLMQGRIGEVAELATIGQAHGKTPAQVALRFGLQMGLVVIPKSVKPHRMTENAGIFDFELSEEQLQTLRRLDRSERIGPDPAHITF